MNKMQIFAKALLEQIEVARVRQLSGLQESYTAKHADTARAIGIFQKYAGLDQTGLPDPKTMNTIKMVAEQEAPANVEKRPDGYGGTEQAMKDWDAKYGKTHNPNGTPKAAAPAAQPVATQTAQPAAKPATAQPAAKPAAKPVFDKSVQDLQNQLRAKGANIKADGFMGPKTQAAMKQFGAKGPASGANPAAASPNPNANEFEIAQAQAAGGAGAAPGKSPYAPAAPAAPAADTTTAGGAAMANKPAAPAAPAGPMAADGKGPRDGWGNYGAGPDPQASEDADIARSRHDFEAGQKAKAAASAKTAAPAAPAGPQPQAVGDDDGNTTFTTADGKTMVVGPNGQQIMPGSNPNLPQNQGALNKLGNWMTNKGQYQKPGGFQPPPGAAKPAAAPASQSTDMGRPDFGVSGESFNRSNQRMVEDPELTAMLRIAGLR